MGGEPQPCMHVLNMCAIIHYSFIKISSLGDCLKKTLICYFRREGGVSIYSLCDRERLHLFYNLERQATAARRVYVYELRLYEQVVARRVGTARISRISS